MNDKNQHDWHDTLIDRGLAELVGGETPPDLTDRILAAADSNQAEKVTLAEGTETMNTANSTTKVWITLAVAVSLGGVVVGLLLPEVKEARETARRSEMQQVEQRNPIQHPNTEVGDSLHLPQGKLDVTGQANAEPSSQEGEEFAFNLGFARAKPQTKQESSGSESDKSINQELRIRRLGRSSRSNESPSSPTMPSPYYLSDDVQYYASGSGNKVPARESIRSAGQRFSSDAGFKPSFGRQLNEWGLPPQQGTGPDTSGDQYTRINENPFIKAVGGDAVSTFSIDVDTASYANVRQFLEQSRRLPPPDAVRIEELVNYFDYDYAGPTEDSPFAAHMEIAACPWNAEHRLARIGIKGREIDRQARPQSNLVFLIDVSGSMNDPNKLPLLIEGMKLLTRELGENDKVAIVVYASSERLALESTRGDQQQTILAALDQLRSGGSTAGGAGIELAYKTAQDNFIKGGVNRVILCTDGDFNVGVTNTADLERMAEQKAKESGVFLTVLGFGRGNLNDAMMEAISGKGNGNYHYVDNLTEARKVLVEEMVGTLVTIAKDVKIQVEFNPAQVAGYRLIGYENRMLRTEDFNDDKKDAGEIGAGHTVTALYEIIPAGKRVDTPAVDELKYQPPLADLAETAKTQASDSDSSGELLTLKLRYKLPDADTSTKIEFPITDKGESFADASDDFKFASTVASFGMLLRSSQYSGNATYDTVLETASTASSRDPHGYRAEFMDLVRIAKQLQR
ncbi:vWA domain-containing protein [Bythopirellula goksoeyrii]|uniref:von Willebrand factor n=1 Tax=Bythopirellula goksoeyrii TaxID=1400387 RepID=A0A5B9QT46_9BACT|nr:VWA domain-containing protein [Bythopirellula goksoeyrii]QEG37281.1 von Willebrand factor [Bythopirellula goksoeyrii]